MTRELLHLFTKVSNCETLNAVLGKISQPVVRLNNLVLPLHIVIDNIVEPETGVAIRINISDNYEQCD